MFVEDFSQTLHDLNFICNLLSLNLTAMSIKLVVPLVTQKLSNECWYASMCMVAYYRVAGPRLGLPQVWKENKGLYTYDFIKLAKTEGMKSILTPTNDLSSAQLETLLRNYGPLWCAGEWDGVGHVVVLTGVEGGQVFINDPSPYKNKRVESVQWFNEKRWKISDALLYMAN